MNIWIAMIAIGGLTFLTRLSFVVLLERVKLPPVFQRGLRFDPIAVLSAIIAPELGYKANSLFLSLYNPKLIAGLVAILVAHFTKNIFWTILAGIAVFFPLRLVL